MSHCHCCKYDCCYHHVIINIAYKIQLTSCVLLFVKPGDIFVYTKYFQTYIFMNVCKYNLFWMLSIMIFISACLLLSVNILIHKTEL